MDESRKIVMLKHMLDDDGTPEDVLLAYLDIAGQRILNRMYPYKEDYTGLEVPDRFAIVQLNVAVYLLNKRGAEGQVQHIENGVHRNYGSADVPEEMLKDVYPFAQAIR